MLIDTHIHLDASEFDADRDEVAEAARAAGVGCFVVPGVEVEAFSAQRALARRHADVRLAFGIHPLYVGQAKDADLERVEAELLTGDAVAVGEIGLDGFVAEPQMFLQERFYAAQLKLAKKHGLPVILHVRRAVDLVLKHLRRIEVCGGIAHAFNGSRQQADAFIAMGFKLGFGGAMTFSGSTRIRKLAAELPLESIVLETDAPDIAPAWANEARNEPANLAQFVETLAELRNMAVEEIARVTTENARSVLSRL